jgi:hypothetical protein
LFEWGVELILNTMPYQPLLSEKGHRKSKQQFTVVIAYSDVETARRGKEVHDRLLQDLGDECSFKLHLWKFDVLNDPALRALATKDAIDANILIISTNNNRELPKAVRSWVSSSLKQKEDFPAALIALLEGEEKSDASPVGKFLREQAEEHHLDFFSSNPHHSGARSIQPEQPPSVSRGNLLPAFRFDEHPYPHWGIND